MHTLGHSGQPQSWDAWHADAVVRAAGNAAMTNYLASGDIAFLASGSDIYELGEFIAFYNDPSSGTAAAFLKACGVQEPLATLRQPLFCQSMNAIPLAVSGGGRRVWLESATPLANLQNDMATFAEYDALHDVFIHGVEPSKRAAIHDRLRTPARPDGVVTRAAAVQRTTTFNAFLQSRLTETLGLPHITKINVKAPVLLDVALCAQLTPLFAKETLEVVLDGVLTNASIRLVNAVMAATTLLTLERFTAYKIGEIDGDVAWTRASGAPGAPTSRVKHIRFIDGLFMKVDGLELVPFFRRYVEAIAGITSADVSMVAHQGHPLFYKKYLAPEMTVVDHVIKIGGERFDICGGPRRPDPTDIASWSLPYTKHDLVRLVERFYDDPDPLVQRRLTAVLRLNFLRDAHRVDLACARGAWMLTADGIALRYAQWLKKHHPSIDASFLWFKLNISPQQAQGLNRVSSIDVGMA